MFITNIYSFLSAFLACCVLLLSAASTRAATFTVTNINDSGSGSLRQAILDAEGNPSADMINVTVTGTVLLNSSLPSITQNLVINGGSQTGFIVNAQGISGQRPFLVKGSGTVVEINNLTVTGGNSNGGGGGIRLETATLTLINVTVDSNFASESSIGILPGGGGIGALGGTLNVFNSRITSNNASGIFGGGILIDSGALTMTGSTVFNNGSSSGGGIAVINNGTARIENSTISHNRVNVEGGGLLLGGGTLRMSNVTVSRNVADTAGGGLRLEGGDVALRNVTIGRVNSGVGGGGIYSTNTAITLANTIIGGGNLSSNGRDFYAQNTTITRLTANIVQFGITDGGGNTINGAGTIQQVDPKLTEQADNGGQVQTVALEASSPAIDTGTNGEALDTNGLPLTNDARGAGFSRIRDGDGNGAATVDLGAFEFSAAPTAAIVSVGGRISWAATKRGVAGAVVTVTDTEGNTRATRTNPFGYYHFNDVAAGGTYIFQARYKRFRFAPQVLTVTEEINNLNFTAIVP